MQVLRGTEKILKALANRRRLSILKYIRKTGRVGVSSISEEIKLSFKATSKHLSILAAAELVEREQFGLRVEYFLCEPLHRITKAAIDGS